MLVDEKMLESCDNPLTLESIRIKRVSPIRVIKKGVSETKSKVLIDKKLIINPVKDSKTMVDIIEPVKNYFDLIKPSDGVVFQGGAKIKKG